MSEIKQINTGVAELLAVKVPEYELVMVFENELFLNKLSQEAHFRLNLPPGNWTPLGIDTELTEEQCAELLVKGGNVAFGELYKGVSLYHTSAKEAFSSLMQANGCFSVNPYGSTEPKDVTPEEDDDLGLVSTLRYQKIAQWRVAQKNTGTWLILKRLS